MCFSATASFTTSAILIPIGIYAARLTKSIPNYLYIALIPLFFGLQQLLEGLVWLNQPNFALGYLFFAYAFWPAYFAFAIGKIESHPLKKKLLNILLLSGIILALNLYLPILIHHHNLKVYQLNHSICYDYFLPQSQIILYNFFYLGILLASCFLASNPKIKVFALLVLISYIIAGLWYRQTFTSVWCFFAAGLSVFILWVINKEFHLHQ